MVRNINASLGFPTPDASLGFPTPETLLVPELDREEEQ